MSPFGQSPGPTTTEAALACPCGTGETYARCCRRLHRDEARATTPEELMRSRYTAYALGDWGHIFRTWHPRTRPGDLADPGESGEARTTWTGLEIEGSGLDDETHGWVAFRAHYRDPSGAGVLAERSRFEVRGGRWLYVDGVIGGQVVDEV